MSKNTKNTKSTKRNGKSNGKKVSEAQRKAWRERGKQRRAAARASKKSTRAPKVVSGTPATRIVDSVIAQLATMSPEFQERALALSLCWRTVRDARSTLTGEASAIVIEHERKLFDEAIMSLVNAQNALEKIFING